MKNESKKIKIKGIPFGVLLAGKVAEGSKTVTRRVVNGDILPDTVGFELMLDNRVACPLRANGQQNGAIIAVPFEVGQLLYVREPWQAAAKYDKPSGSVHIPDDGEIAYLSDNGGTKHEFGGRGRIASFMPARFARTFLRVTEVRCERLGEISGADAINEGVERIVWSRNMENGAWIDYQYKGTDFKYGLKTPIESFFSLWDSINGKDSHLQNPWVWVISFERVEMPNPWNEENEFAWGWRKAMVGYVSDACSGLLLQVVPDMATGLVVGFLNETNLGDFKTYPSAQLACQAAARNHYLGIAPKSK